MRLREPIGVYEIVTAPAAEPITLGDAKAHARIDTDDDDDLVTALITVAREWVEQATGRCLINQQWRLTLDNWPGSCRDEWWDGAREGAITQLEAAWVDLRKAPFVSIGAVETLDEDDAATTWASSNYYLARQPNGYGRLTRKAGVVWPIVVNRTAGAIRITFTAGYGAAPENVPFPLRQAIKLLVAHLYETREPSLERGAQVPFTIEALLSPYKVMR